MARAADRLALSAEPPFDLVVSSDLTRAQHTAELLASALGILAPVLAEPGLREYDVAAWSGCTTAEIERRWPGELELFRKGELDAPPGGEDRSAFHARVVAAGRRVSERAAAAGARRILVVTHGGVVRALAAAAGRIPGGIGHLAGYWGRWATGGLLPIEEVNLVDRETSI